MGMRITFILPNVSLAGGTRVVVIHAQELARMGHVIRLISPPPAPFPLRYKIWSWLRGTGWPDDLRPQGSYLDDSGLDHHVLDRSRRVVDSDVPDGDVVIATWWETAEWVNALSSSKGAKVYFIQHHEIFPYIPIERCEATYRMPLHKIVVAPWLKQMMSTRYSDDIVDLVPNSVDRSQFFSAIRGKQAVPTVGFLYSTVPFKGLDVALAALDVVRRRFPQMRMISFGSERPRAAWPLPEDAEFEFSPPQNEIRNIYARCDVWVTASRSEGFNLPAMEAMACRTPVVATRTGWPEEAVKSGWNGILVDVDDTRTLAEGVSWVLSRRDEEWRLLSANAYATVESSSWRASAEMFEKALEHACQRSSRGEIAGRCTRFA